MCPSISVATAALVHVYMFDVPLCFVFFFQNTSWVKVNTARSSRARGAVRAAHRCVRSSSRDCADALLFDDCG